MYAHILKAGKEENPLQGNTPTCIGCAWRREGGTTCEAFPQGIPVSILVGVFDHHASYELGDVSDQGLQFITEKDLKKDTSAPGYQDELLTLLEDV